ncbi:MAG: hypothetical protein D6714_08715, partial [Bacteroidetes bacterium]
MGKNCPRFHVRGGGFECRRFSLLRSVVSLEKGKVSLLTELEIVRGWFSTKMSPLRGFYSDESRAGKRREIGNLWQAPKINGSIHFTPK